jgi:hypothetical protein
MVLQFCRQLFEKSLNIKVNENRSSVSRVVPRGRTDRRRDGHDEANSHFSQLCESTGQWQSQYELWHDSWNNLQTIDHKAKEMWEGLLSSWRILNYNVHNWPEFSNCGMDRAMITGVILLYIWGALIFMIIVLFPAATPPRLWAVRHGKWMSCRSCHYYCPPLSARLLLPCT